MPSVFQQREAEAERAHAKAAIAVHMHMIAAKKAAVQRAQQLAAAKKHINPQKQQAQTMQHAAHQEDLLEANMHERGPYGWLGSYFSDVNFKEAQKTNGTASLVSMYKNANANLAAEELALNSTFGSYTSLAYNTKACLSGSCRNICCSLSTRDRCSFKKDSSHTYT